jgi:nucleotide-binding universal stress UspA family protein
VAIDGSDQSLEVVRYIGNLVAADRTDIVLFHVGTGFPEVFWDMDSNPLYHSKKNRVMNWLANSQLVIGEFKEKAHRILADAGIPPEAVMVHTQTRKTGILEDIVQETYQGYTAMAVGRTGVSRMKDLLIGSLADKLAARVNHIPTVVVEGRPASRKILIALDESIEAMRAVHSVGLLVGGQDIDVCLCHVILLPGMFRVSGGRLPYTERELDWLEYRKNAFRPVMAEATRRLVEAGVPAGRIAPRFEVVKAGVIRRVIETAYDGKFGTIVVGRRESIGFMEEHLRGRFGARLIQSVVNMAVWVVA